MCGPARGRVVLQHARPRAARHPGPPKSAGTDTTATTSQHREPPASTGPARGHADAVRQSPAAACRVPVTCAPKMATAPSHAATLDDAGQPSVRMPVRQRAWGQWSVRTGPPVLCGGAGAAELWRRGVHR